MFLPQLPITFVFGRPSRVELLGLSGCALLMVSAVAWARMAAQHPRPAPTEPPPTTALLEIASSPNSADVFIDGQPRGTTPATAGVVPGRHDIVLQAQDAIAETRSVDVSADGTALALSLWRTHPSVTYLKPPLPGALLSDAVFLAHGRLALQVALPDGERQSWTLDPAAHLAIRRLADVAAHAPLAVRPDGQVIAVLQPRTEAAGTAGSIAFSDHVPAGEVWLVPTDAGAAPRQVWTASEPSEELVDLTWAPDEAHLILVGRQPTRAGIGATRTVIRWLDTESGQAEDLALLPSQVAPGTYVWSPDGQTVAFVVHTASLAAVCTLSVAGDFRYLGDLGHDGLAGPPVAPVAWAPEGRVILARSSLKHRVRVRAHRSVRTRLACSWPSQQMHLAGCSTRHQRLPHCGGRAAASWPSVHPAARTQACGCASWIRRAVSRTSRRSTSPRRGRPRMACAGISDTAERWSPRIARQAPARPATTGCSISAGAATNETLFRQTTVSGS